MMMHHLCIYVNSKLCNNLEQVGACRRIIIAVASCIFCRIAGKETGRIVHCPAILMNMDEFLLHYRWKTINKYSCQSAISGKLPEHYGLALDYALYYLFWYGTGLLLVLMPTGCLRPGP